MKPCSRYALAFQLFMSCTVTTLCPNIETDDNMLEFLIRNPKGILSQECLRNFQKLKSQNFYSCDAAQTLHKIKNALSCFNKYYKIVIF